jgi:hypothetical protein
MLKDRINEYFTLSPRRILQRCARDVCALLRAQDSASTLSGKDDITACSPFSHPIAIQPKEPADDSHASRSISNPIKLPRPSFPSQTAAISCFAHHPQKRARCSHGSTTACLWSMALLPAVQSTLAGLCYSQSDPCVVLAVTSFHLQTVLTLPIMTPEACRGHTCTRHPLQALHSRDLLVDIATTINNMFFEYEFVFSKFVVAARRTTK